MRSSRSAHPTGRGFPISIEFVTIERVDDERLATFRLNERGLANRRSKRDDGGAGLFLAEGDLVVERALEAGCRPFRALVDGSRIPPVAGRFVAGGGEAFAGGEEVRQLVAGLGILHSVIALFHRPPRPSAADAGRRAVPIAWSSSRVSTIRPTSARSFAMRRRSGGTACCSTTPAPTRCHVGRCESQWALRSRSRTLAPPICSTNYGRWAIETCTR